MGDTPGGATGGVLSGLAVVELAEMVAGPYTAKLLADLGAEVVKVEPPGGDPARRVGPFVDDRPGEDRSVLFLHLNTSKQGVRLDTSSPEGARLLAELVGRAELLVTDRSPDQLAALGLGPDQVADRWPGLVVLSLTPFGWDGPYRDWTATPLTTFHGAGEGYLTPVASHLMPEVVDRPPLRQGRFAAEYKLATYAATLCLGALFHARATGQGQVIELSKQDALIGLNFFEFAGLPRHRGRADPGLAGRALRRDHPVPGRLPAVHLPRGAPVAGPGQGHGRPRVGPRGVGGHRGVADCRTPTRSTPGWGSGWPPAPGTRSCGPARPWG